MGYRNYLAAALHLQLLQMMQQNHWLRNKSKIEYVPLYRRHMSKWFRFLVGFADVNKCDLQIYIFHQMWNRESIIIVSFFALG